MITRPPYGIALVACAVAGMAMTPGAGARAAAERDPYYNSDLFLLCDSPVAAEQLVCTTYMNGFAEGYIQNSKDRCYAPTGKKLKDEYVLTIRRDPNLLHDRSGGILFSLMDMLTTTKCAFGKPAPAAK